MTELYNFEKYEQIKQTAQILLESLQEILDLTDDPDNNADPEESAFTNARLVIENARKHL